MPSLPPLGLSLPVAAIAVAAAATVACPAARAQTPPDNPAVTVTVDVAANRRPISPLIYSLHRPPASGAASLNIPLYRHGGNNTVRYNWQQNADNKAHDWFFQSIALPDPTPGEFVDSFLRDARAAGAEGMITIPMIGWVAKLGPNRSKTWSFSQAKYGAQTGADKWYAPDAGNGVLENGQNVIGNDPNDANVPVGPDFINGWLTHLKSRWGTAATGGIRFYALDNEPSIWSGVHRDVQPRGMTAAQTWEKIREYGTLIKSADPGALLSGPEEWGWTGYFYSGLDQQDGPKSNWSYFADREANGGRDYSATLLKKAKEHEDATGQRLLDYFSLHCYPQGGEYSDSGNDVSEETQRRRNRSTRDLWDPNHTAESWIGQPVKLIPRMKEWVSQNYPGTKIAITEYDWGADGHINGATAQADVLGILGREGVDLATKWRTPEEGTPGFRAFQIYRNYDGNKSTFGDVSVSAAAPDPDTLSAFGSQDSATGAVKVMVIAKSLSGDTPVTVAVANHAPGATAQVYQITAASAATGIARLSDVPVAADGRGVSLKVPAQSLTLIVLPRRVAAAPPAAPSNLTLPAASGTSLRAQWADNSADESGFSVEISRDGAQTWTVAGTAPANATSLVISGLTRNTPYSCRVRAFRDDMGGRAHSPYSNTATGHTPKR